MLQRLLRADPLPTVISRADHVLVIAGLDERMVFFHDPNPALPDICTEKLPKDQQQKLLLFLARRLREAGTLPEPRLFSEEQLKAWMNEDEEDMRRLRAASEAVSR